MSSRGGKVGTIVLGLAGAFLIALAPLALVKNSQARRAFEREREKVLAEVECDLSTPGEHVLPVRVDYLYGHGLKLLVLGPARPAVDYEPAPWLKGLKGVAGLDQAPFDATGGIELGENTSFASGPDGRGLARLPGSPPGEYVARVVVTDGAPALAGVPHRLAIMNDVCGCELMGPAVLLAASVIPLVIGFWLCLWAVHGFVKAQVRPIEPPGVGPSGSA